MVERQPIFSVIRPMILRFVRVSNGDSQLQASPFEEISLKKIFLSKEIAPLGIWIQAEQLFSTIAQNHNYGS